MTLRKLRVSAETLGWIGKRKRVSRYLSSCGRVNEVNECIGPLATTENYFRLSP